MWQDRFARANIGTGRQNKTTNHENRKTPRPLRNPRLHSPCLHRLRVLRQVLHQEGNQVGLRHEMLRRWQDHLRHLPDLQRQEVSPALRLHRPRVLPLAVLFLVGYKF